MEYITPQEDITNLHLIIFALKDIMSFELWILTKNYMCFNCGAILTYSNCIYIVDTTTPKTATCVAETSVIIV